MVLQDRTDAQQMLDWAALEALRIATNEHIAARVIVRTADGMVEQQRSANRADYGPMALDCLTINIDPAVFDRKSVMLDRGVGLGAVIRAHVLASRPFWWLQAHAYYGREA